MNQLKYGSGEAWNEDDVITEGITYWRPGSQDGDKYLISCTHGYLHNITQEVLNDYTYVGKYIGNEKLFECD